MSMHVGRYQDTKTDFTVELGLLRRHRGAYGGQGSEPLKLGLRTIGGIHSSGLTRHDKNTEGLLYGDKLELEGRSHAIGRYRWASAG